MIVKMLTHMHMVSSLGGVGTFAKEKVLELMLINLWEKEVTGGRSGHVGRTVRQYNSCLSREGAALVGLEGRTADGPPLGRGQSAGVLKNSSKEVVSLARAER